MKNLPDSVSFLKANGHVYADFYPIWKVWMEAGVIRKRLDRELASQTMSRFVAGAAANPQSKKAAKKASKLLDDYIKRLNDG